MKHLLFISPLGTENKASGLSKKIRNQIQYFEKKSINVDLFNIKRKSSLLNKIWTRLPYTGVYYWPVKMNESKIQEYNYIYIRYHASDYQLLKFLKKVKSIKKDIKVIIEIPTYPYGDENAAKLKRNIHVKKDIKYREKLQHYVDYIVTFSKDKEIFNIPTISISNTVDFKSVDLKKENNNNSLDLVAVGSLYFWHGYDRVIEGLKNYYTNEKYNKEVNLHMVGGGPELTKYKELVRKYNLENHVFLYGPLMGSELNKIYNKSDVALDSLGRHRSKVYYNSSLKGKEYGAKGLPIISGVETELDDYENYDFYKRIPADETPVDIFDIVQYYKDIELKYANRNYSRIIREFNKEVFDVEKSWGKVYKKLEEK